jgi:transcription elongation factor Elf1
MENMKTIDKNYTCEECKNSNIIDSEKEIGDIVECDFCGVEYEILEKIENGEFEIRMLEEEK